MKKALVVLLALALVGGAFADAPVANVDVAEFTGSATVTWGVDLDNDNATGFKNETEAVFKVNIADGGSAATEGDGVWGEIAISTDGLQISSSYDLKGGDADDDDFSLPVKIGAAVDKALLHLGPVYMGILADGTEVAGYKPPVAVDWNFYEYISTDIFGLDEDAEDIEDDPLWFSEDFTTKTVGDDRIPGVVFGYESEFFSVALDLRNFGKPENVGDDQTADGQYHDDYAIRAALTLTPIDGLTAKAGFSYAFDDEVKGLGASVEYALPIGDNMSLTPGVGYATTLEDEDKGDLSAGLLFGFNGMSASVTTHINLNGYEPDNDLQIPLLIGFDAGDIVENLSFSAAFGLFDLGPSDINAFTFKADLAYAVAVGDGTVTPSASVKYGSFDFGVSGVDPSTALTVTIGAEFAGFVDNTTFNAVWESGNLTAEPDAKMGTFDVSITIAL
jgi:hypothetical protein